MNTPLKDSKTAEASLQTAAKFNNLPLVKSLLSQGADANARDKDDFTCLHLAAIKSNNDSHFDVIETLLKNGADVNAQKYNGKSTALHELVKRDNVKTIKLFFDHNADVNAKNKLGCIPLMGAVECGNFEIVKLLVDNGSDVNNAHSRFGFTSLHISCYKENYKIVKYLLKHGVNPDVVISMNDLTPLMYLLRIHEPVFEDEKIYSFLFDNDSRKPGLHTSVFLDILRYVEQKNYWKESWKILLKNIAKLQSFEEHVSPKIFKIILESQKYRDYFNKITDELSLAKTTKLKNTWVTYFNLLMDSRRKLKNYAGNQDLIEDFKNSDCLEKFPAFGAVMQKNLESGIERRELFDKSAVLLSNCLPIFSPTHLIVRDTLDYILSKKDLSKFCE